jgi:hypothetical protein
VFSRHRLEQRFAAVIDPHYRLLPARRSGMKSHNFQIANIVENHVHEPLAFLLSTETRRRSRSLPRGCGRFYCFRHFLDRDGKVESLEAPHAPHPFFFFFLY